MNFIKRHKKKLAVFGVVSAIGAGGLYLLNKYVDYKIAEQKEAERQEKLRFLMKQQQFAHSQNIAEKTLSGALLPALKQVLSQCLSTETILQELKQDSANVELWQQLKLLTFGKCSAWIVCSVLTEILTRIQLHLLTGYNVQNNNHLTEKLQQQFMKLTELFINNKVQHWVESDLLSVLKPIIDLKADLKEDFNVLKIQDIFNQILVSLQFKPSEFLICGNELNWTELEKEEEKIMKALIMDLMDIVEHGNFENVMRNCFEFKLSLLLDHIAQDLPSGHLMEQKGLPLAKLIPKLDKIYNSSFSTDLLEKNAKLQSFEANIFETFCLSPSSA